MTDEELKQAQEIAEGCDVGRPVATSTELKLLAQCYLTLSARLAERGAMVRACPECGSNF